MAKRVKIMITIIAVLGIAFGATLVKKANDSQKMEISSKILDSKTQKCSEEKPNCVSSFQEKTSEFYIAPLKFAFNPLSEYRVPENCKILKKSEFHHHYTCKSSLLGFIDDLELYYDKEYLHFRSESRVGYSDLGKNKERIEKIKNSN